MVTCLVLMSSQRACLAWLSSASVHETLDPHVRCWRTGHARTEFG